MLKPGKLFAPLFVITVFLNTINQSFAQNGTIFVENLQNPVRSLQIDGLPDGSGYFELDECGLCMYYGNTREMINSAKEILANNANNTYFLFEERKQYEFEITAGRGIHSFANFWHISDVNTDKPKVTRLQKKNSREEVYTFPFNQASNGDVLAFSLTEDELIQEHGNPKELIIFIPVATLVSPNLDLSALGDLVIPDLGHLSIGGLPKNCNAPIASILNRSQRLSAGQREEMVYAITNFVQPLNYIDAEITDGGYTFDLQLHLNKFLSVVPQISIAHFRKKPDGSFAFTRPKHVNVSIRDTNLQSSFKVVAEAKLPLNPASASTGDVIEIYFNCGSEGFYLYLPIRISGKLKTTGVTSILGTTLSPKIPYMILHDPPGDGSFSTFESGKSFCRATSISVGNSNSFGMNGSVKLGIAGSAGLIVTSDFEFSTTISAGLEMSTTQNNESSYETCINITETIQTSNLASSGGGLRDGDDLFIGYGTEYAYGVISDSLFYEGCTLRERKSLVMAPTDKQQQFILTERGIREDIVRLESIIADNPEGKGSTEAQNQIDVWKQVLQLNQENKRDESELIRSIILDGGNSVDVSEAIIATATKSIETELFFETTAGIEFLAEAGGSGVSGGVEFSTSHNFGISSQAEGEIRKLISYQLHDDDQEDRYNIDVYRDPMYGTPYFKLRDGSHTSCPYEGGDFIDAPKLYNGATCGKKSKFMDIVNAPIGAPIFAPLQICNESAFVRSYSVRLDGQTNPFGAIFDLNGRNLNNISEGQVFVLPPNTCIQTTLQIWGNPRLPNQLDYYDIRLFVRPGNNSCHNDCDDEGVEDALYINIHFSENGIINYCGNEDASDKESFNPIAKNRSKEDSVHLPETVTPPHELSLKLVPNPSGEFVHIHYQLPTSDQVNITILDLHGKIIKRVLSNQIQDIGKHSIVVQNLQVPSGTYLVQLQTMEEIRTEQLIVLRD